MNEPFEQAVRNGIQSEIEKIILDETEKSAAAVKERIRQRCAAMATAIVNKWSLTRRGDELIITIHYPHQLK